MGVGSLYRYSASTNVLMSDGVPSNPGLLYVGFLSATAPGTLPPFAVSNRVCDGVIHFYLQAFATNGFPIVLGTRSGINVGCFRPDPYSTAPLYSVVHPTQAVQGFNYPGNLMGLYFWSNAVPASVEFGLGLLEQPTWDRYNSIPAGQAQLAFLQRSDVTSAVHLFRQRIPIRNVDPSAYQ